MDEFKPEDGLRPDPSDRRKDRSRNLVDQNNEPIINFDDVSVDDDDRRSPRGHQRKKALNPYETEDDDSEEDFQTTRRPYKQQNDIQPEGASRQRIMMGVGILVLLLLVVGIGSALKSPSGPTTANFSRNDRSGEKSIDISGNAINGSLQQSDVNSDVNKDSNLNPSPLVTDINTSVGQNVSPLTQTSDRQNVSLPPVSETPTQPVFDAANQSPQHRVELQGDLGTALSGTEHNVDNSAITTSSLPTQPATVAKVNGRETVISTRQAVREEPRRELSQRAVRNSEPKKQSVPRQEYHIAKAVPPASKLPKTNTTKSTEQKAAMSKSNESVAAANSVTLVPDAGVTKPEAAAASVPASQPATSKTAAATTSTGNIGNVSALQSAPGSSYTLQLSSSSNINNLNGWAKKENLQNYVVYQTRRNGQPWYVLVTGVYGSKDEAKKAVALLPTEVQAKNPWTKPIRQVQADLRQ